MKLNAWRVATIDCDDSVHSRILICNDDFWRLKKMKLVLSSIWRQIPNNENNENKRASALPKFAWFLIAAKKIWLWFMTLDIVVCKGVEKRWSFEDSKEITVSNLCIFLFSFRVFKFLKHAESQENYLVGNTIFFKLCQKTNLENNVDANLVEQRRSLITQSKLPKFFNKMCLEFYNSGEVWARYLTTYLRGLWSDHSKNIESVIL